MKKPASSIVPFRLPVPRDLAHSTFFPPGQRVTNESTPFDLYLCAQFIIGVLNKRADAGDSPAALMLAEIASDATVALTSVARANPALLLRYSRMSHGWPVIKM